ncbi:MAG: DUF2800 domain-containing protein [Pirellulales bacterium]
MDALGFPRAFFFEGDGMDGLPAHSDLGASGTHRWMHCSGSVNLIRNIRATYEPGTGDNGNEYSRRGTDAHGLAAYCILMGEDPRLEPNLEADDRDAVACYVDAAQKEVAEAHKRFGDAVTVLVEHRHHLPEVHNDFFGANDLAIITPAWTQIWDYKHGVGVLVEVKRNPQFMQYAVGCLRRTEHWKNDAYPVELVVAQPRGFHPDGPIRSWWTTVGDLKAWLENDWLRAARATEADGAPLITGLHCHDTFCEARLRCPAMRALVKRVAATTEAEMKAMEDWELGLFAQDCIVAGRMRKLVDEEVFARLRNGRKVSGWKIVNKKGDRVFKQEREIEENGVKVTVTIEQAATKKFGDDAYAPRELRSPAQLERLDGGKKFVAEWAYKPDNGQTVAPDTDARQGAEIRTPDQAFASLLQSSK